MKRRTFVAGLFGAFQAAVMAKVGVKSPLDLTAPEKSKKDDNPNGLFVVEFKDNLAEIANEAALLQYALSHPTEHTIEDNGEGIVQCRVWIKRELPYHEDNEIWWGETGAEIEYGNEGTGPNCFSTYFFKVPESINFQVAEIPS